MLGPTSRYDMKNQQRFTDLIKKLEKRYTKKQIAKLAVDMPDGLAKAAGYTLPDIIFFKTFVREYLSPNRAFLTHLSTNGLTAQNISQFFSKERKILAGAKQRAAGATKGLDVAPQVYLTGEKGPRGQIRSETIGYGGLTYLGLDSGLSYKYTIIPKAATKPTIYFMKERISGNIYNDIKMFERKFRRKLNPRELKNLVRKYEKIPGTIQPDYQSITGGEAQASITPGTILKIEKQVRTLGGFKAAPSGFLGGYNIPIYKLRIVKAPKHIVELVKKNLNKLKSRNYASNTDYNNIISSLKKHTGIDYSIYDNTRYVQLPINVIRQKQTQIEEKQNVSRFLTGRMPIRLRKPEKISDIKRKNIIERQLIPDRNLRIEKAIRPEKTLRTERFLRPERHLIPDRMLRPEKTIRPERAIISERTFIPERPIIPIRLIPLTGKKKVRPKKIVEKKKKKGREYILRPTIANMLYGTRRRIPIKVEESTGFEVLRL